MSAKSKGTIYLYEMSKESLMKQVTIQLDAAQSAIHAGKKQILDTVIQTFIICLFLRLLCVCCLRLRYLWRSNCCCCCALRKFGYGYPSNESFGIPSSRSFKDTVKPAARQVNRAASLPRTFLFFGRGKLFYQSSTRDLV